MKPSFVCKMYTWCSLVTAERLKPRFLKDSCDRYHRNIGDFQVFQLYIRKQIYLIKQQQKNLNLLKLDSFKHIILQRNGIFFSK